MSPRVQLLRDFVCERGILDVYTVLGNERFIFTFESGNSTVELIHNLLINLHWVDVSVTFPRVLRGFLLIIILTVDINLDIGIEIFSILIE